MLHAGDCKLEYDRATGCYIDHAQLPGSGNAANMYSGFAQPAPVPVPAVPLLPSAGPSYQQSLHRNAVNGESMNGSQVPASDATWFPQASAFDRVFQKAQARPAHQPLQQQPAGNVSEGPLSTEELEYDDTDLRPGDKIQEFHS